MFKNIARKIRKKKNKYSIVENYNIHYQSLKIANRPIEKDKYRKIVISNNQIKNLSNEFYSELYSLKNLTIHYSLFVIDSNSCSSYIDDSSISFLKSCLKIF